MIARQQVIAGLIQRSGGSVSRLRLVKLAFLFAEECAAGQIRDFYQFVPYRYGPFSFTLYHELDNLARAGILRVETSPEVALADAGLDAAAASDACLKREIDRFWLRYGKVRLSRLVDSVYLRYPWYTLNSEQLDRRAATRPVAESAIYTVGFGGHQVDGFLNLLLVKGIRALVDVRYNPVSRRYGFHKSTMAKLCVSLGIEYRHAPEVGVPSSWRTQLQTHADYRQLFSRYDNEILTANLRTVVDISEVISRAPSALACQEADPSFCHRSRLAARIQQICGLSVKHLGVSNVSADSAGV